MVNLRRAISDKTVSELSHVRGQAHSFHCLPPVQLAGSKKTDVHAEFHGGLEEVFP